MRPWALHAVFATLLVGSLVARELAAKMAVDTDEFEPAVTRVARSQGLAFQGYVTLTGPNARALAFEAPGCSRPVLVVAVSILLDIEALFHFAPELDGVSRYVYIGRTWEKPDRLAFYVERMKYAVLKTLRLTRYVPDMRLLLVDSPSRCHVADRIDWQNVWNRDYLGATQADTEAANK
jgi:hypothetical protein